MLNHVDFAARSSSVSSSAPDVGNRQGDCDDDGESALTQSLSTEEVLFFLCFWWWWIPVDAKKIFLTCVPLVLIFNLR